jgi:hypothetical protein
MSFELERVYEVWSNKDGVRLIFRPDSDGGGYVQLCTPPNNGPTVETKDERHFGKIRLVIPPKFAKLVGEALIQCAKDLDREGSPEEI